MITNRSVTLDVVDENLQEPIHDSKSNEIKLSAKDKAISPLINSKNNSHENSFNNLEIRLENINDSNSVSNSSMTPAPCIRTNNLQIKVNDQNVDKINEEPATDELTEDTPSSSESSEYDSEENESEIDDNVSYSLISTASPTIGMRPRNSMHNQGVDCPHKACNFKPEILRKYLLSCDLEHEVTLLIEKGLKTIIWT